MMSRDRNGRDMCKGGTGSHSVSTEISGPTVGEEPKPSRVESSGSAGEVRAEPGLPDLAFRGARMGRVEEAITASAPFWSRGHPPATRQRSIARGRARLLSRLWGSLLQRVKHGSSTARAGHGGRTRTVVPLEAARANQQAAGVVPRGTDEACVDAVGVEQAAGCVSSEAGRRRQGSHDGFVGQGQSKSSGGRPSATAPCADRRGTI